VRGGVNVRFPSRSEHRWRMDPARAQQFLAESPVTTRNRHREVKVMIQDEPAHERIAVGMQAARRQAYDRVTRAHALGAEHPRAGDNTDPEGGEVVLIGLQGSRVLGGLASKQRAPGEGARLGYAAQRLRPRKRRTEAKEVSDGSLPLDFSTEAYCCRTLTRAPRCRWCTGASTETIPGCSLLPSGMG
jgi:hypothetical protein